MHSFNPHNLTNPQTTIKNNTIQLPFLKNGLFNLAGLNTNALLVLLVVLLTGELVIGCNCEALSNTGLLDSVTKITF